uniref:Uncharacterized protein n=1 Tax=Gadus morhua TaxID=8049 RepID=A0A8C5B872_GADMO
RKMILSWGGERGGGEGWEVRGKCLTVKTTGSDRYTLLSLLMEAVMTGEFTITERTLAFSVDRPK